MMSGEPNGRTWSAFADTRDIEAQEAMAKFTIEKDIAQHIKRTVGSSSNSP
jgi:hypothetical protein